MDDAQLEYDVTVFGFQLGAKGRVDSVVDGFLKKQMDSHSWSQHLVTNIQISFVDERKAKARAKLINPQEIYGFTYLTGGDYTYELEKQGNNQWKIKKFNLQSSYLSIMIKFEALVTILAIYVLNRLMRR